MDSVRAWIFTLNISFRMKPRSKHFTNINTRWICKTLPLKSVFQNILRFIFVCDTTCFIHMVIKYLSNVRCFAYSVYILFTFTLVIKIIKCSFYEIELNKFLFDYFHCANSISYWNVILLYSNSRSKIIKRNMFYLNL